MLRDDGSEDYAVFKKDTMNYKHLEKKILIPLRNQMGNVYGLYARSLDKSFYKHYATSEEKLLGGFFGLFDALPSIYEKGYVYVVEGPMDCISLRKAFPNVVASLTAFINEQQIEFLKFFVKKIIVVFDGDAAGERGAESVSNTYGEKLISVKNLAGYKDANSCLTALGLEKFKKFAKNKLTVVM
jgi:DNA primase